MAFDLNNPPGYEDEGVGPAADRAEGGGNLLDLNIPAAEDEEADLYEDIPATTAGEGGPYGVMDLNMPPDLGDEANIASGDEDEIGTIKFISKQQRNAVYKALQVTVASNNGKIKKNSINLVATTLEVNIRTIQRIWHDAKNRLLRRRI